VLGAVADDVGHDDGHPHLGRPLGEPHADPRPRAGDDRHAAAKFPLFFGHLPHPLLGCSSHALAFAN
jgi:hypothetical protein